MPNFKDKRQGSCSPAVWKSFSSIRTEMWIFFLILQPRISVGKVPLCLFCFYFVSGAATIAEDNAGRLCFVEGSLSDPEKLLPLQV